MRAATCCQKILYQALAAFFLFVMTVFPAVALEMRGSNHATFSRLVIELDHPVETGLTTDRTKARLLIKEKLPITNNDLRRLGLTRFGDLSITPGLVMTEMHFTMPAKATVRHWTEGGKIIVDVSEQDLTAPPPPAGQAPGAATDSAGYITAQMKALKEGMSPEKSIVQRQQEAVRAQELASLAAKKATAVTKALGELDRQRSGLISVRLTPREGGVTLAYDFPAIQPAAAVLRGDELLLAWPGLWAPEHPELEAASGDRIRAVSREKLSATTLLRYKIRPGLFARMTRKGTTWTLELQDTQTLPREALRVEAQADPVEGRRLFVAMPDAAPPARFADTVIGGKPGAALVLVGSTANSAGMLAETAYPSGMVLASVQGLAVLARGDQVRLGVYRNGVALMGMERSSAANADMARGSAEDSGGVVHSGRMLDLSAWGPASGAETFSHRKAQAMVALSLAGEVERQARRWDLARLFLAYGMDAEARGVLEVMAQAEPNLLDLPAFRAARGRAALALGDYEAALTDFSHNSLVREPEAALWRTLALEALRRYDEAVQAYTNGAAVIAAMPDEDRVRFQLAGIRAMLKSTSSVASLQDELARLVKTPMTAAERAQTAYLRGQLAAKMGDKDAALTHYIAAQAGAEAAGDRRTASMAAIALINDEVDSQKIGAVEAIDRLDRLRFAWRGDQIELDLLERLGVLYVQTEQYREGLLALRQAVSYFPTTEQTTRMAARMDDIFRSLFLDGAADRLPPLAALSLYYDYRQLTPLGPEGDMIVRKLVDRLVSLDLLDRAIGLLTHQIKFRLEGVAQATVATRLAMLHLLNGAPDEAMGVLRATRQSALPDDILRERNQIEARALIDLNRPDEAEVVLEGDTSTPALLLRADAFWRGKDWGRFIETVPGLLPDPAQPLTLDQQRLVVRLAVAQVMAGDDPGLANVRTRYGNKLQDPRLASAFDLLTTDNPERKATSALDRAMGDIDRIDSFLAAYRQAFGVTDTKAAAPKAG